VFIAVFLSASVGLFFGIIPGAQGRDARSIEALAGGEMSRSEVFSAARMALATIAEHKMAQFPHRAVREIIGTATVIAVAPSSPAWIPPSPTSSGAFGPSTLIVFKIPDRGSASHVAGEEFMRKPLDARNSTRHRRALPP